MSIVVTIEDVKLALGDTDPRQTNAGALRRILNRGSMTTIQKHLDLLRAEIEKQEAEQAGKLIDESPPPPAELTTIWLAAIKAAGREMQSRLLKALDEIENLKQEVSIAKTDAASAMAIADEAMQSSADAISKSQDEMNRARSMVEQAGQDKAEAEKQIEQARQMLEREKEKAEREAELLKAQYELKIAILQNELDRQVNHLASLRAALPREAA